MGDHIGALADYTKALEINPTYANSFYDRGLTKMALGDKKGACLDWEKAADLGYDLANTMIKKFCN